MRRWKTVIHTVGGEPGKEEHSASYKTYSLAQASKILLNIRERDGTPKRKVKPVSVYIFENLMDIYFRDYFPKGNILEQIIVEDSKHEGL